MKSSAWLFALFLVSPPEPAIRYFTQAREVKIAAPDRQNYFVVDAGVWNRARPDLADLRLYDGETPVSYALSEQRGGVSSEEQPARILNLGSVAGRTQFDLDLSAVPEYNRIRLCLDAKNFLVTADVEGMNTLGTAEKTRLGSSTLYDFSRENLGANCVLALPTASFRYLHVRLSPGIRPQQVKTATASRWQERKASWTPLMARPEPSLGEKKKTQVTWMIPAGMPVDRIHFHVAPEEVNFRRTVTVTGAAGALIASGEISRIRITRGATTAVSETLDVDLPETRTSSLTVAVDNGDDPPLQAVGMQLLSLERRIYFDPQGKTALTLHYGDEKLSLPVYDYAKFFRADPAAVPAQLGPDAANRAYEGRADDRPWSERHQAVLWVAMIVAVALLAGLALKGLRSGIAK
jgi:hypothetical protein